VDLLQQRAHRNNKGLAWSGLPGNCLVSGDQNLLGRSSVDVQIAVEIYVLRVYFRNEKITYGVLDILKDIPFVKMGMENGSACLRYLFVELCGLRLTRPFWRVGETSPLPQDDSYRSDG